MKPIRTALSAALLFVSLCSSAQWKLTYDGTVLTNQVQGASFYSPSSGYIATNGWVGFTTDSGYNFQKRYVTSIDYGNYNNINILFGFWPFDVKGFSGDTVIASGNMGGEPTILYSTNNGVSWKMVYHRPIPANTNNLFNTVYQMTFPGNGNTGFAIHHDQVLRTLDRGKTWNAVVTYQNRGMHELNFVNASVGFAAASDLLLRTTNGGNSWTPINNLPFAIRSVSALSDQKIFVNTSNGDTYYTINGGTTWIQSNSAVGRVSGDIHFINDSTGYAAAGYVYKTRNYGKSWEIMPGFTNMEVAATKLVFLNENQAWACAYSDKLLMTANALVNANPRALFEVNTDNTCSNNTVQLINQSASGYSYQWFRNGSLIASTYNASYTVGNGADQIKLVVSNGTLSDTMTTTVNASGTFSLGLDVQARADTVCSNGPVYFDIFNSRTDVFYAVTRACCGSVGQVRGNGGTLTIYGTANSHEDSTAIFQVRAFKNGDCGSQLETKNIPITMVDYNPATTALKDTFCKQQIVQIRIPNSRIGYHYWVDTAFSRVPGTGGTILLPARLVMGGQAEPQDIDGLVLKYDFPVYVRHIRQGCGNDFPVARAIMISRMPRPAFYVGGFEWFTNEFLPLQNNSRHSVSYNWTFEDGGTPSSSTSIEPTDASYATRGYKQIKLITQSLEGCVDSATRTIEVFDKATEVPEAEICAGTGVGNSIDSVRGRRYSVNRDIYEDEYGNRVIAGGYTTMYDLNSFRARGFEGWYAIKYDKNGQKIWELDELPRDPMITSNIKTHIVIEQAIGDSLGYTYLLGHANKHDSVAVVGQPKLKLRSSTTAFLLKVNPQGRVLWVRSFHNRHPFDDNDFSPDFSSGTLLRGKKNDVYIVTHCAASGRFFMDDQLISNTNKKTGMILHLDSEGRLLRSKTFPAVYNNLRRLTDAGDQYDYLPRATWDNTGRLVIYCELNPAEAPGNNIDGFPIGFDLSKIKSSLLFYDTASLSITAIKPIFRPTSTGNVGIKVESFALDASGDYYAGHTRMIVIPVSAHYYITTTDTLKPKSFISKFDASGNLVWTQQSEGLQPYNMTAYGGKLKVSGTNYADPNYLASYYSYTNNQSPRTNDVRKLTVLGDTTSFLVRGAHGLGSRDLVVATLQTGNGQLQDIRILGTAGSDDSPVMKKGYGEQIWVAGTGSGRLWESPLLDSVTTLRTYKLPINNDCITDYRNQQAFVKLDILPSVLTCTNDNYTINWSSQSVSLLNIFFSVNNGGSYTSLASSVASAAGTYSFNAIQAGATGNVKFRIQDAASALFDTVSVTILPYVTPAVSIAASATTICSGTPVTFTAAPVNAGPTPSYKWMINNASLTTSTPIFTSSDLKMNDQVKVILTSSASCVTPVTATSNIVTMTVNASTAPSVTITTPASTVCQGAATTFTATPVNAGVSPTYQWQVNGTNVGMNSNTFTTSTLNDGNQVKVIVTNTSGCATSNTATSNTLTMAVAASPVPTIALVAATEIYQGTSVLIQALTTNAGPSPLYNWQDSTLTHSWQDISSVNTSQIIYQPTATGIRVRCILTSSFTCANPRMVISKPIVFTVTNIPTAIDPVPAASYGIRLYPNPATTSVTIDTLRLADKWETLQIVSIDGRSVLLTRSISNLTRITIPISHLTNGMYMVVLRRKSQESVYWKFAKY